MADVVGLLTSAIVTQVGAKLGSAIADQVTMLCSFKDDMEDMKEVLESVSAVLKDAERRSIREELVRLWLKRLKNAALDISDMLDKFQDDSKSDEGKVMEMLSCLTIVPKISMANKMKKIREQLRKIKDDHKLFKFESDNRIENDQFDDRETTSKVIEAGIIGRDRERKRVIALLSASNDNEGTKILPIFGLGGIGKTTLAQLVFNHIHFKDYDHRVWVYVSQVFDLKKIGNTIISQVLKEGRHNGDNREFINQCLQEVLDDKKILIILDDLWETNASQLNELKLMLNVSSKMKVLVTTRNEEIANMICTSETYRLSPLNNAVCWDIIKKNTNFELREDKQQLEEIGQAIASKCGGIPLAAQALGFMLSRMDLDQWKEVSNSDIWNEPFAENSVLPSLKLTYIAMPPYLRLCFAYCAIFPRGHVITKDNLIHQWIALDFIKSSIMFSDIHIGEKYVGQLLGMSFLQHSKLPTTAKKGSLLTMHDLVYDLARSVMDEELIVYKTDKVRSIVERKYCRYALLTNCCEPLKISTILAAKLRALLFQECSNLGIHGGSFSFAKCLRVLDLTESSINEFPKSIGQLKQLRFLAAPGMKNQSFPNSISGLLKLQYLDLSDCSEIEELPKSIRNLKNMIHLELSCCSRLKIISEALCYLTKLQYLNLSCCTSLETIPQDLGNIIELHYLNISSCYSLKSLPQDLCNITKLHYLNLSSCFNLEMLPQDLGNLIELQYLCLSGCHKIEVLPESLGKLTNLVHLDLSQCSFVMPEALSGLTKLKYLNLSRSLAQMHALWDNYIALTNLNHLDLSWNSFPSLPESIGNLKRLHTLDLSGCKHLRYLPESIGSIDSLEVLLVNECAESLKDYIKQSGLKCNPIHHLVVQPNSDNSGCNLHQLEGINPSELQISCLEKVRIRGEANGMELYYKENLSTLTLHWTMEADRSLEDKDVLEELVPPNCLKHLKLEGYSSICFPKWQMSISHSLPNLVSIRLENLPRCSNLPPLGQLPNLERLYLGMIGSVTRIDGDFCGSKQAFGRLTKFTIKHMRGLEEWNTTYHSEDGREEFMFPVLEELVIGHCPKLRLKPCPPVFHNWKIINSDEVLNSWEEGENFSDSYYSAPRFSLVVWSDTYSGSWRILHHLPTLQKLGFNCLHQMTRLPDSMKQLGSLRTLELFYCNRMSMLPEWLGDLKSLESLNITSCKGLESLPSSIDQLSKLQKLYIKYNPELKRWCESEENKMKLTHINDFIYEDFVLS